MAPSVVVFWVAWSYARIRTSGNFFREIKLRKFCENGKVAGSKFAVIVLLSGNRVQPNRRANTELLLSVDVLLMAMICGRRLSK